MKSRIPTGLFFLSTLTVSHAQSPTDGATLFNLNCAACHQPEQMLVGPSLAEIRSLYLDKPGDFVKWCVTPGKKRPGAVDMPSMVHVGEPGLRAIHKHIMAVSKGLKAQKAATGDPFIQSPTQTVRPLVLRIFLPNAGPAAIGVALDDTTSLCWDAGECRLRYAWTGGFINGHPYWKGNGSSQAKIIGKIRYTEASPILPGKTRFHGYDLKDGFPVFRYSIDGREITETFSPLPDAAGFTRSLTIQSPTGLSLDLPASGGTRISSDKGKIDRGKLALSASEAASFTLTHLFQ